MEEVLATKRVAAKKKSANSWKGFIDCELTTEDKYLLKTTDATHDYPPLPTITKLVEDGYKFSLSFDKKNDTYIASLTDQDFASPTEGYTLTGRGGEPIKAITALLFKHFIKLEDGWITPAEQDDDYS